MRASTGLGSLLVSVLLTTVHGAWRPTHQELVATIARLEARTDAMEHKVAALEKEDVNQRRVIMEQQSAIGRLEAALTEAAIRQRKRNIFLSNRVQRLEQLLAARTNPADRSTPPQEQRHSGSVSENNGTGISQGHPMFTEVPGRWTSMDKTPVTTDHNHEDTKRLLLTEGGDGPVAFMARMHAAKDRIGIDQNIVFETVLMNIGNGYHNQHGIFIAPLAGIYIFSATIMTNRVNDHINAALVHNGNTVCMIYVNDPSAWQQSSHTALIQVQQGDEVWLRNINYDNVSLYGDGYNTFSGYLLWPM